MPGFVPAAYIQKENTWHFISSQLSRPTVLMRLLQLLTLQIEASVCTSGSGVQNGRRAQNAVCALQLEQQTSQLEMVRHKNMVLLEDNKQLQHRVEALDRSVTQLLQLHPSHSSTHHHIDFMQGPESYYQYPDLIGENQMFDFVLRVWVSIPDMFQCLASSV